MALDHLTVLVEGNDAAREGLRHSIKAYIGITVDVRAGSIERFGSGKAKRIIDNDQILGEIEAARIESIRNRLSMEGRFPVPCSRGTIERHS